MRTLGRYRLDAVLGSGGFATVWRGDDTELHVPVAVKVLAENWSHQADVRERFLEEARLLRRIADPRVVRVHDIGLDGDQPYFVMDLAEDGTLAERAHGDLPLAEAAALAVQACRSVHVLHEAGVVHRDVKPGNLLVHHGRVVVADLGSVKRLAEASGYTVTTGTPAYMAPEQVTGGRIDARTDVFALAVVTYVLVTGALPYDVADPTALLRRTAVDRPRRLGLLRDDADPAVLAALDSVLGRAMSVDPDRRQATAAVLAHEIEAAADGRLPAERRRAGVPTWLVAAAAVVAFAGSALASWVLLG